jgi:hypothetical protein
MAWNAGRIGSESYYSTQTRSRQTRAEINQVCVWRWGDESAFASFSNGNQIDKLPDPTAQRRGGEGSTAATGLAERERS